MNRFNIDELIWFITLIFIAGSLNFLIKTGEINNFIHEDMMKYFFISIGILILFIVFQFSRIFTLKRRVDFTNKFIPIIFTILVGVGLFFVVPITKGNDIDTQWNNNNVIAITAQNHHIIENNNEYLGEIISFVGYIEKDGNNIYISRNMISCCQSDKVKISIKASNLDESIEKNQWINVVGKILYDEEPCIEVMEFKLMKEPKDIYL